MFRLFFAIDAQRLSATSRSPHESQRCIRAILNMVGFIADIVRRVDRKVTEWLIVQHTIEWWLLGSFRTLW